MRRQPAIEIFVSLSNAGAQFVLDGLTLPLSNEAEKYAQAAMQELLISLQPVKGVFVPDCYFHGQRESANMLACLFQHNF